MFDFLKTDKYIKAPVEWSDYHAANGLELGELIATPGDTKFFDMFTWEWDYYNESQRNSVIQKIINRYYHREISITPISAFKLDFTRRLNERMERLKPLYEQYAKLDWYDAGTSTNSETTSGKSDIYYKGRDIHSEFPQTLLNGNSDYASFGDDKENEQTSENTGSRNASTRNTTNKLDAYLKFQESWKPLDLELVRAVEPCFSCIWTYNINGY